MIVASTLGYFSISQLLSYGQAKHSTTDLTELVDVTQRFIAQPKAAEIIPLFGFDADVSNGAEFHFSDMSDVSYNPQTSFSLSQGGNGFTTNQFDRKREVEKFEQSISAFHDSLASDTIGREHSAVYFPIAESLNALSKSTADKKILLVYSDLMENETDLSFYDRKTLALLACDPEKIKAILLAKDPLANLSGIEIHFVYQPENAQADSTFRLVSAFYKKLLEEKGATVFISANLTK